MTASRDIGRWPYSFLVPHTWSQTCVGVKKKDTSEGYPSGPQRGVSGAPVASMSKSCLMDLEVVRVFVCNIDENVRESFAHHTEGNDGIECDNKGSAFKMYE
mmetsp:Transcript_3149/g.12055  ORF Transcript_3149/g.12055 Transcript_3149/m.12055 type:complete len:102 (-) Transcript_3149:1370-1675(-)